MLRSRGPAHSRFARRQAYHFGLGFLAGLSVTRVVNGQARPNWPTRPIRLIVPSGAGSGTDIATRLWGAAGADSLGQSVIVENRTGAGATIGGLAVARSAPDGYTIGVSGAGPLAVAPTLYARLAYDPRRDFTFITPLWRQALVVLVQNELPARSVPELLDLLRRNPGRFAYGHGGLGTLMHLAMELLKSRTGIEMEAVAYGGPQLLLDLERGDVQVACSTLGGAIATMRDGKVRAIAVTSLDRNPAVPDVPPLADHLPGFDLTAWEMVIGPAGMPPAISERIDQMSRRALERPDLVQRLRQIGFTPWQVASTDLARYRADQEAMLAPVIRASGVRID